MAVPPTTETEPSLSSWEDHARTRLALWRLLEDEGELIQQAIDILADTLSRGCTVFWCGNGGSASQAQHLGAELVGRFESDRPGLRSISLATDVSALTAIANDTGYHEVFRRQLSALSREGDALVALSTSGRSANVVSAARYAREHGLNVISLTGRGGDLAELAHCALRVQADNVALVQEGHLGIGHYICGELERRLTS